LREERRLRVFENRVFRRICRSERDEESGEWRRLHNEEYDDLYWSPNIVRVIKSRIRWPGHEACRGRGVAYTGCWWGNLRGREHLGHPGIHGRIILRWIFRKWNVGLWT
jgi:hypothetical protein